jgi:hypothetical protein
MSKKSEFNSLSKYKENHKFLTPLCNDTLTFQECELAILRNAVDESDKRQTGKVARSPQVQRMIKILENFLRKKKCICYGGTAINNILPKKDQFYNRYYEVPDYDFYSKNALDDTMELADLYKKEGFEEIEAKSGVHHGTFKVYVNFIAIADITQLHPEIFDSIKKETIKIEGIYYAPPNFLRMSMFLELSRPDGDVSRWEKVLKRLNLLNKYYPLKKEKLKCENVDFQRNMETGQNSSETLYYTLRNALINNDAVFFGGYASSIYSRYMPPEERKIIEKIPDFDVLCEDAEGCAKSVVDKLKEKGFEHAEKIKHDAIGEIIPEHFEIRIGKEILAFIFYPIACHNYNTISVDKKIVKIATIDTILSFYLAFYFTKRPYFQDFQERILCIAQFLFKVEEKNRLEQRGVLKRFSLKCYGKQPTIENIKEEKMKKYEELKNNPNSTEYKMWFLKYSYSKPKSKTETETEKEKEKVTNTTTKKTKTNTKTKTKTSKRTKSKSHSPLFHTFTHKKTQKNRKHHRKSSYSDNPYDKTSKYRFFF